MFYSGSNHEIVPGDPGGPLGPGYPCNINFNSKTLNSISNYRNKTVISFYLTGGPRSPTRPGTPINPISPLLP